MPISRQQFERGTDPAVEELMGKINSFLGQHKDEAYTNSELVEAITGVSGDQVQREAFDQALSRLLELGMVEKKAIGGNDYYSSKARKRPLMRY